MADGGLVLGVVGATGRLGTAVLAECARRHVRVGMTASRSGWTENAPVSVVVDASAPEALGDTVGYCERTGAALIYCVSKISEQARERLARLAGGTPVVLADNLSVGHWLQTQLIRTVAELTASLPETPRMSVHERHPLTKRDRPSASARSLAAVWAASAPPSACGETTTQRSGQPVSDHVVAFDLPGMSLSIQHSVSDLRAAATGLIDITGHVCSLPPGTHAVYDVYSHLYGRSEVSVDGRARQAAQHD